jgi:hypothetical protein
MQACAVSFDRNDLALEMVPLGTMTATMAPPLRLDGTPAGTRIIVEFTEIVVDGEKLRAKSVGHTHGDWLTVGGDGTGSLDARFVLETHDGALLYVHGLGRNDAAGFFDGAVNLFSLSFETGDARYAWLNRVQAIAKGRRQEDGTVRFSLTALR